MVTNDFNTVIKKVIILHSFVVTKMYGNKLQKQAERQPELKRMGNVLWLKLSTTTTFCWRDQENPWKTSVIVGSLKANIWTPTYQTWSWSFNFNFVFPCIIV